VEDSSCELPDESVTNKSSYSIKWLVWELAVGFQEVALMVMLEQKSETWLVARAKKWPAVIPV
jgi:hypothetical protein